MKLKIALHNGTVFTVSVQDEEFTEFIIQQKIKELQTTLMTNKILSVEKVE